MYYNEVLMQVLANEVDGNDTMQGICESLESIGFRAFGESLDNLAAVVKDENAQILVYRAIHNNSASRYVLHTVETLSIKQDSFGMIDVALALRSVEEIVGIGHHTHKDTKPKAATAHRQERSEFYFVPVVRYKYAVSKRHNEGEKQHHSSPREHERSGHYRHYKSGKVVYIQPTTVNKGHEKVIYRASKHYEK